MSIETLGEAYRLGWRVRVRCIRGIVGAPVSLRKCEYKAELDMQTLVWAKGHGFPLGRLGSRLMCPQCESKDVNVIFEPPATIEVATTGRAQRSLIATAETCAALFAASHLR